MKVQLTNTQDQFEYLTDGLSVCLEALDRLNTLKSTIRPSMSDKSVVVARMVLEDIVERYDLDVDLSVSTEAQEDTGSQIGKVLGRVWKAIVSVLEYLIDLYRKAVDSANAEARAASSAIRFLKERFEQMRRDGAFRTREDFNIRNLHLFKGLSIGGKVEYSQLQRGLANLNTYTDSLARYVSAQSNAMSSFSIDSVINSLEEGRTVKLSPIPIFDKTSKRMDRSELNARRLDERYVGYKSDVLPGERILYFVDYRDGLNMGSFRQSSNTDSTIPFSTMKYGLQLGPADPTSDEEVSGTSDTSIHVLNENEIRMLLQLNQGLLNTLNQKDSDFRRVIGMLERLKNDFKNTASRSSTVDQTKLGYIRDYAVGLSTMLVNITRKFKEYDLAVIEDVNNYVRISLDKYQKTPKR